jgi:hypothetical protein
MQNAPASSVNQAATTRSRQPVCDRATYHVERNHHATVTAAIALKVSVQ